jgi:hypothetical protein
VATCAKASVISVGSPAVTELEEFENLSGPITVANAVLGEPGALFISPVDGAVVRWHVTGFAGGPFRLRVLRPAGAAGFAGAGTSASASPSDLSTQTFATNLSVKAGDLFGVDSDNFGDLIGEVKTMGSSIAAWLPPLPEGGAMPPKAVEQNREFAYSVEIQPAPGIAQLDVNSAPVFQSTRVLISGHDFLGVTGASFGGLPASGVAAINDNLISATAPAGTKPGPVSISVTTNAGTSPASPGAVFTYLGCMVPKLKGNSLKADRKKLAKAGCKLGKVSGKRTKTAKVKKQSVAVGKVLPLGTRVSVKLGE